MFREPCRAALESLLVVWLAGDLVEMNVLTTNDLRQLIQPLKV